MSDGDAHPAKTGRTLRPRAPRDRTFGQGERIRSSGVDPDCRCYKHTRPHLAHLLRSDSDRRPSPSSTDEVVHVRDRRSNAVHRMPPEILGIIFEHCLDGQAPRRAVLSDPPLLLGRVCSYWRSVSQCTPRLWTALSLRFLETDVDRSRDGIQVANAVETWLKYSYPAPLSLAFTDNRIFQNDSERVLVGLLSCIRVNASRWKELHLKFSSDYFVQLDVLSSCAFSSLKSFSVHVDHMGWRRGLLSLCLDLARANQLTSLAYTGPDHVIREDVLVDWTRLTSVAFSYDLHESGGQTATLPRHFSTLALCRNLTELSIGLSTALVQHLHPLDAMAQGQVAIPMIELSKLHTLRVRRLSRSAHACALIDALRLPNLSTLEIDSAVLVGWDGTHVLSHPDAALQTQASPPHWHAHHFSALLDRSECRLHTLRIRDVDMSSSELTRLLTSPSTTTTLSTFSFEPFPRSCPISDVLAYFMPEAAFPRLTHLRLGCAHETHLEPLADVIASRTVAVRAGVCSLALFELVFYDFVYSHGPTRPWRKVCFDVFRERVLRCAKEGGVDVDIRVERPYEPVYLSVPC